MTERKAVLRVTVTDLETNEKTEEWDMPAGEYVIVVTTPAYIAHEQVWGGGKTVQLTIKDRQP